MPETGTAGGAIALHDLVMSSDAGIVKATTEGIENVVGIAVRGVYVSVVYPVFGTTFPPISRDTNGASFRAPFLWSISTSGGRSRGLHYDRRSVCGFRGP